MEKIAKYVRIETLEVDDVVVYNRGNTNLTCRVLFVGKEKIVLSRISNFYEPGIIESLHYIKDNYLKVITNK